MKRVLFLFIYVLIPFILSAQTPKDFTAVDLFWQIVDELENDRDPGEDLWTDLFSHPAYSPLGSENALKRKFRTVFMPSMEGELNEQLETMNYWWVRDLRHLMEVKENRMRINKFRKEIAKFDLYDLAADKAFEYLPEDASTDIDYPDLYFLIFSPDARVYGNTIIMDLHYASLLGEKNLILTMAHELHHKFAFSIVNFPNLNRSEDDYYIFRSFLQLPIEGIADFIQKEQVYKLSHPEFQRSKARFFSEYYNTPLTLHKVDSLIQESVIRPEETKELALEIWQSLPGGAHPNGYYMSKMILEAHGHDKMVNSFKNPIEFARLYQSAVEKLGGYYFSEKSMAELKRLEEKYVPEVVRNN